MGLRRTDMIETAPGEADRVASESGERDTHKEFFMKLRSKESDCGLFSILHLSKKNDIIVESVLGRR